MSLKKQLIILFGALAFIALVVVGVTFWTFGQWRLTSREMRVHYTRNLLLEQIRAAMYQAFKEVPDAVTGDDPNSKEEFIAYLKPAERDFKAWAALPSTQEELAELKTVRLAYDSLVQAANYAFDLVEAGKRQEAVYFMENNLEDRNFAFFQKITDAAAASDRHRSSLLRGNVQKAQDNAQVILIIAALGAVALILLLSAYISFDLFKPLREVEAALNNAARDNLKTRFEEGRNDEIGRIYEAFNRLMEETDRQEKIRGNYTAAATPAAFRNAEFPTASTAWNLRILTGQLHELVSSFLKNPSNLNSETGKTELLEKIEEISRATEQVAALDFPTELNLSRTDISALLYEVVARFFEELSKRAVNLEVEIEPKDAFAVADKLKLREALNVFFKNAIAALPETGGKIGVRARLSEDNSMLWIEIADCGKGLEKGSDELTIAEAEPLELKLAKVIVEQHGGQLKAFYIPEKGNYLRIELPFIQPDRPDRSQEKMD